MICTAAITTSQFITRSQCLEEFWKLPAGFVARWSCWQYLLHAESWKNEVMAKGRILTPEGFFFPFRSKNACSRSLCRVSTKEFPTSGFGDGDLWSLVFISFEISALVPLSTHGWDRTLPWHTLNLPCKKTVYHLLLPPPGCKMGPWAGSSWVQVPFCGSALAQSSPFSKGHTGTGHQDRAWADEPRAPQISGGAEPVAQGQAVFLEVAGWQQSLVMGCINEL